MYQTEIDKFSRKIDKQNIRMEAKKFLYNVVEEFFSDEDYHNISEERKRKIEDNFQERRIDSKIYCTTFDVTEVDEILNQMENSLFTILDKSIDKSRSEKGNMIKTIYNISASGHHSRVNINSEDKSVNIMGDELSNLEILIERDYKKDDKKELLQVIHEMKESCNDPSKKNWLREKLGWLLSRTSEVASISSLVITILQQMK